MRWGLWFAFAHIWARGRGNVCVCRLCLAASLHSYQPFKSSLWFLPSPLHGETQKGRAAVHHLPSCVPACVLGMLMVLKSSKYPYHGECRFWTLLILSCTLCIRSYKSSHETKLGMRAANFLVMVEDALASSCGVVPFLVLIQMVLRMM